MWNAKKKVVVDSVYGTNNIQQVLTMLSLLMIKMMGLLTRSIITSEYSFSSNDKKFQQTFVLCAK